MAYSLNLSACPIMNSLECLITAYVNWVQLLYCNYKVVLKPKTQYLFKAHLSQKMVSHVERQLHQEHRQSPQWVEEDECQHLPSFLMQVLK